MIFIKEKNTNIYRLLRIARDITAKELAEKLGVTPAYISAIENGTRIPTPKIIKDYSAVLNVPEEIILKFSKRKSEQNSFEKTLMLLLRAICNNNLNKTK